jgi:hypothetical protein
MHINVPVIKYKVLEMDNFKARKVFVDDKEIGECHMSFKSHSDSKAVVIVRELIKGAEVLDPENVLKLEYGSYFKYDPDSILGMSLEGVLKNVDERLGD